MSEAVNKKTHLGTLLLGILLLILGVLLLMSRAGVFHLNFTRIIAFIILIFGGFQAITAFASSNQRRLFWGSMLFLTGMLVLLISYEFIPDSWDQIWPSALIIPGLSFLMLYFANLKEFVLLTLAVLFVVVGWAGLLAEKGNFSFSENVLGTLRFLVPVAVVLAGFYVIWKNFFPKDPNRGRDKTRT